MFLLVEQQHEIEILTEKMAEGGTKIYLEGVFAQSEKKNRNGRFYPKGLMEKAVEDYQNNYINERRSLGELNHPAERPFADPKEAALMVESLSWKGNDVIGKALVMNTREGKQVQALLEANFKLGVSTRGLGALKEQQGTKFVKSYMMTAIDGVDMPSGQDCYPNMITESVQWVEENGIWIQKKMPIANQIDEATLSEAFEKYLDYLKKQNTK